MIGVNVKVKVRSTKDNSLLPRDSKIKTEQPDDCKNDVMLGRENAKALQITTTFMDATFKRAV